MRSFVCLWCARVLVTGWLVAGAVCGASAQPVPSRMPAPSPAPSVESELGTAAPAGEVSEVVAPAAQAPAAEAQAGAGTPELTELTARLTALLRLERLDDSVRRPLDFARAALERSRMSHGLGDLASEQRTRQLARAAVELAEARLRLLRERALFTATQARRNLATAEEATARRALERERARALELQRESAAP
jgi:hypothetical protein